MTDIPIPREVVEAAAKAAHDLWRKQASVGDDICEYPQWEDVSRFYKDDLLDQAEAALRAGLKAWPGMEIEMVGEDDDFLILPLSQEAGDE